MNGKNAILIGEEETYDVTLFFTFSYRGKCYAAFLGDGGETAFIDVNVLGNDEYEIVNDEDTNVKLISLVMKTILNAARKNPKAYPLDGGHYNVQDVRVNDKASFKVVRGSVRAKRTARASEGTGKSSPVLIAISVLARMAVCFASIMLFMAIFGVSWIDFYLPKLFTSQPLLTYALTEAVVVIAAFFAIRPLRKFGKFSALAILTLFFFSGLGAVITNGAALRCTMTVTILLTAAWYLYGVLSVNGTSSVPGAAALIKPLKSTLATLLITFVVVSNLVIFLLGVDAPLPKITEKETTQIEMSYKSALGTIHPDQWKMTDKKSRITVLQGLTDGICATELGCFVPEVKLSEGEESSGVIAKYNDSTKTIVIDAALLDTADSPTVVMALLSECRRAWQYYVKGMYDSISDTLDKAYLGLETLRDAAAISKDFAAGCPEGGYSDVDRKAWSEKKYKNDIEAYILYRNGVYAQGVEAEVDKATENADAQTDDIENIRH